jgi:hypothetical protein
MALKTKQTQEAAREGKPLRFSVYEFPEVREAQAKLGALEAELKTIETTLAQNDAARLSATERAMKLLESDGFEAIEDTGPDRQKLSDRAAILRQAIEFQRAKVQKVKYDASAAICNELAPEYRKLITKIAGALEVLAEAVVAEREFRGKLAAGEVNHSFGRDLSGFIFGALDIADTHGVPGGFQGPLRSFLASARDHYGAPTPFLDAWVANEREREHARAERLRKVEEDARRADRERLEQMRREAEQAKREEEKKQAAMFARHRAFQEGCF